VGTLIQDTPQRNPDSQSRWDRLERADLFEPYREVRTQGISARQAATALKVPRTTLHAWRMWHDRLDICPHVAEFFQSGPGLAFVHRLVVGFHLVCVEVGACGMRLACLFLKLTGLERFVAASDGAQQQVNGQVEAAMVADRQTATARLAKDMPRPDITVTQDETCTGGLCLVGSEPVSHVILVEQLAQRRDQAAWNARMAPALAQLNGQVMQSTSAEAPGLSASVVHHLEAHHSPDVFHVPHALSKAVCAPMATTERAAHKAATEAQEPLDQVQAPRQTAGDEPEKRGPGRPPTAPVRLEQAQRALEAASREPARLAQPREQGAQSLRGIGHDDHGVDLERGVRRHGQLMAAAMQAHLEQVRAMAQHEGLSQSCLERMETAERVVPTMQATITFVSGDGRQQVEQLDLTPLASCAMHAALMPAYDLDRVAQTRTVSDGEALRELAERLRTPLFEPGGALSQMRPEVQDHLQQRAKTLAAVFQRSSANVEGRNGSLSRRNHQLRGLDLPRKRECLTAIHNFFLTRSDGTTAAERCFGQKPRSMLASILASVELPHAPLSPPRLP
jgi:Family of unknown function (DUF6399)